MAKKGVVVGLINFFLGEFKSGRLRPSAVTQAREAHDFVEREPIFNTLPIGFHDHLRIARESVDNAPVSPPTKTILEGLRKIPMEHGDPRGDSMALHGVEEAVVKIDTPFVHFAIAVWQNARPCDREAVVSHPERGHDGEVGVEKMVVVAGRVESVSVVNGARLLGKAIPNGLAFSIEVPGSLDLRSCGGKAPLESSGEVCRCAYHFRSRLFHFPGLKNRSLKMRVFPSKRGRDFTASRQISLHPIEVTLRKVTAL